MLLTPRVLYLCTLPIGSTFERHGLSLGRQSLLNPIFRKIGLNYHYYKFFIVQHIIDKLAVKPFQSQEPEFFSEKGVNAGPAGLYVHFFGHLSSGTTPTSYIYIFF